MLCITLMEFRNLVGGRGWKGKGKFISVMQSIRVGLLPVRDILAIDVNAEMATK